MTEPSGSARGAWLAVAAIGLAVVAASLTASAAASGPAGDPQAGRQVFRLCAACHAVEPGAPSIAGPTLHGVVGREVASVAGFTYSEALRGLGGRWDLAALDRFIADPTGVAPGTKMVIRVADPRQRADLLAYLATLRAGAAPSAAAAPDFGPGWPSGPGQVEAGQLCSACHSLAIVKQQRLSRERWDELFDWMIAEQGMAPQPPDRRALVIDYLATHFGAPAR